MIHEIFPVGILQCNCSILGDEASRTAIVVDPGDNIEEILAILARHQLRVEYIVITHAHEGLEVKHYRMGDSHYTWWACGRSYLCRIIDMLHMGYVDEVLFGAEVLERLP
jgi:hypothetical protein